MIEKILRDCFKESKKLEEKGIKHKGLLLTKPNRKQAQEYVQKAKLELELCDIYKQKGIDYKIAEEWFYILYYCALSILSIFGVETRSQKYTALFLRYVKDKRAIDYRDEFIERIMVHTEKQERSEVDEREHARYSSEIKSERVKQRYEEMTMLCKSAISQCEEIIFSDKELRVPRELLQ